jgi:putative membrane protein
MLGLAVLGGLAPARYRGVRRAVADGTAAAAPRAAAAVTAVVLTVALLAAAAVAVPG